MDYGKLKELASAFNVEEFEEESKSLYRLRDKFCRKFTPAKIKKMELDDYVQGLGSQDSFCYYVERKFDELGRILGASSKKFGVYYSSELNDYEFAKKFGDSVEEAFENIKQEILMLLEDGNRHNLSGIVDNYLSPMFKGKILSLYYPDDYLSIFSDEHLDYFLRLFNLDTIELMAQDAIYKREALVAYKKSIREIRSWSLNAFQKFLYQNFHPNKAGIEDSYEPIGEYSYVENIEIDYSKDTEESKKNRQILKKINFEESETTNRIYGDRGEEVVMRAEVDRLMEELCISRKDAEKKVVRVSLKSDSFGYDILSCNKDGSERYIEVKATILERVGDFVFYYTQNEYEKAMELKEKYYIYYVYDVAESPKILRLRNPFLKGELEMMPIKYRVSVHTKKIK